MTSFLTTSEERDLFLQWLKAMADDKRVIFQTIDRRHGGNMKAVPHIELLEYWHARGSYESFLNVVAYVQTGGKL